MEEKILQVFNDLAKENNLGNLSETTIKEYAKAFNGSVEKEEDINDAYKATHLTILRTMNGQLYKQNKEFNDANKADYEKQLEEYKKANPKGVIAPSKKEDKDPEVVKLQEEMAAMRKKEEEREQAIAFSKLIQGIKDEFKDEDKTMKSKFENFVDNSNKIISTEDVKTNFDRVKSAFEAHERIDLDSGRTRMSAGVPTGFNKNKYDKYFSGKDKK